MIPPDVCSETETAEGEAIPGDLIGSDPYFIAARFAEPIQGDKGEDVIWVFNDSRASLLTKIRCTATYTAKDQVFDQRLGIEELVDIEMNNHDALGRQAEGFCQTGSFGVDPVQTVHTDRINAIVNTKTNETGEACVNIPKPTKTIQKLCKRYFQGAAVSQCRKSICNTLWFPFYESEEDCLEAFAGRDERQWYRSFCKALHGESPTAQLCEDDIFDFGIDAIQFECSELEDTQYPAVLTECQTGVEVQYYGKDYGTIVDRKQPTDDDEDMWRPYVAIPTQIGKHLCPLTLDGTHEAVFKNPVRMRQKSIPSVKCLLVTPCQKVQMVATQLEYTRESSCDVVGQSVEADPAPVDSSTLCNLRDPLNSCKQIEPLGGEGETVSDTLPTMPACCPLNETSTPEFITAHKSYDRFAHACNAICNPEDPTQCCDDLTEEDTITFKTTFSDLELDGTCCKNCTCYGDPRCWSFDNSYKLWIPCDARDESSIMKNGVVNIDRTCKWTKENCESVRDHKNRKCEWVNEKKSLKMGQAALKKIDGEWVPQYPCKVVNGRPCLHMYSVNSNAGLMGQIKLAQGPRGIIETFWFMVPDPDDSSGRRFLAYELNAKECLQERNPWRLHRLEGMQIIGGG